MARTLDDVELGAVSRRRAYGGYPSPLQDKRRLEWTKAALRTPGVSLPDLAQKLGYAQVSGLSAAFRRYVGMSPTQYAAKHGVKPVWAPKRGQTLVKRRIKDRTKLPPLPPLGGGKRKKRRPKRKPAGATVSIAAPETLKLIKAEVAAGGASLTKLARRYGYAGPRTFSSAFKRYVGVCPTKYAKKHGKRLG